MNANELADELDKSRQESFTSEYLVGQAATMLRQQQAEIEALKKEAALQRLSDFTQEADNEPVAIRYDFDGYGYQYMDSGSGSDWQTRVEGEFLYTHPAEHDLGIAEAIGFDKGYAAAQAEIKELKNGFYDWSKYIKLQIKQLTDEEINEVFSKTWLDLKDYKEFARAILRKANEK